MPEPLSRGCDRARLSAYRDGELEVEERQVVATHLVSCQACRTALHSYAQLASALQEPVSVPPLVPMKAQLGARLRRDRPQQSGPWRRVPGLVVSASAALVAMIALAGLGGLSVGTKGPMFGVPVAVPIRLSVPGQVPPAVRPPQPQAATAGCAQPLPGVVAIFSEQPELRTTLGCATDAARMLDLVSQRFERGSMLRRSDTHAVYAITADGRWRQYADPGPSAQSVGRALGGGVELSGWFQRVWVERPDVGTLLGRVLGGHQQFQSLVQPYERGVALWDARGQVYLLMDNGASLYFFDQRATQAPGQDVPLPRPTLEV